MPTARGWLVFLTGFGLWGVGRGFGAQALEQLGFGLIVLVIVAVVVANFGRHELAVSRRVLPERAHAGQPVKVALTLNNTGGGAAPLLFLNDRMPMEFGGSARFAVRGIEPKGEREVSYTVRAPRRGRYELGPLELSYVDPFGLARVRVEAAQPSGFLAAPRVERLRLPRDMGEPRSLSVAALRQPVGARGEDFYTLREYTPGDDLRRIHWRATAKRDRPMIRQEETPWHTRATIVLDDRLSAHGNLSSFERAVEAAASLCDLYHRSGYSYRLASALLPGSQAARGESHYRHCLDLLSVIEAETRDGTDPLLVRLAEIAARPSPEGTLVLVAGDLSLPAAAALARCRRRFRQIFCVLLPPHRYGSVATRDRWDGEGSLNETRTVLARSSVRTLVLSPGDRMSTTWESLVNASAAKGGERWAQRAGRA